VRIGKIFSLERQAILQGLTKLGAATLKISHAAMYQRGGYPSLRMALPRHWLT
jgi:hypothetical protein